MITHESCQTKGCWVARLLNLGQRPCADGYCEYQQNIIEIFTPGPLERFLKERKR